MGAAPRDKRGRQGGKTKREAFFVRTDVGDGTVAFFNATEHIGRVMPFKKPKATCAMRVSDEVVSFSLLHLTNRNAPTIADKPIAMPGGPLSRLERRAATYADLPVEEIIVELSTRLPEGREDDTSGGPEVAAAEDAPAAADGPALADLFEEEPAAQLADLFSDDASPASDDASSASDDASPASEDASPAGADDAPVAPAALADIFSTPVPAEAGAEGLVDDAGEPRRRPQRPSVVETFRLKISRDSNNVASLESIEDEHVFELGKGAVHISIYMKSPVVGRMLAVGFIGHVGKPGTPDTITRGASMVLNSLSHLSDFRILSGIETVSVPAPPNRAAAAVVRRPEDRAAFESRVYLFGDEVTPVGSGTVVVEFDLENANPTTGRLLWHVTPAEEIAELWPTYQAVFDTMLVQTMRTHLSDDEIAQITYDIVLGGVEAGTVERLREVGKALAALDMTPLHVREHG